MLLGQPDAGALKASTFHGIWLFCTNKILDRPSTLRRRRILRTGRLFVLYFLIWLVAIHSNRRYLLPKWIYGVLVLWSCASVIHGLSDRSCRVSRGLLGGLVHLISFHVSSLFLDIHLLAVYILGSERCFLFSVWISSSLKLRLPLSSFVRRILTRLVNHIFLRNFVNTFSTFLTYAYSFGDWSRVKRVSMLLVHHPRKFA